MDSRHTFSQFESFDSLQALNDFIECHVLEKVVPELVLFFSEFQNGVKVQVCLVDIERTFALSLLRYEMVLGDLTVRMFHDVTVFP